MTRHNALKSLWGDGPANSYADTARKNTAKSMISPGERPQDIRTPPNLLAAIRARFGGEIALDACDSLQQTPAAKHFTGSESSNGLTLPWEDKTYCNPPYKNLKEWLQKAVQESESGSRIVVLCPVRPHRRWFRAAMRATTDIVYLDPVVFSGYDQAFPAPLCLLCFNVTADDYFTTLGESVGIR